MELPLFTSLLTEVMCYDYTAPEHWSLKVESSKAMPRVASFCIVMPNTTSHTPVRCCKPLFPC